MAMVVMGGMWVIQECTIQIISNSECGILTMPAPDQPWSPLASTSPGHHHFSLSFPPHTSHLPLLLHFSIKLIWMHSIHTQSILQCLAIHSRQQYNLHTHTDIIIAGRSTSARRAGIRLLRVTSILVPLNQPRDMMPSREPRRRG